MAHFWPRTGQDDWKVTRGQGSQLRNAVSEALHQAFVQSNNKQWNVFVGLTGQAKDAGRNQAQPAYLTKLLDSRIVVVAQKDGWEDHYRLMEALASGAMVMTDPMWSWPVGLEDGVSLVVYRSLSELVSKAKYYLENEQERQRIALQGYKVAMTRHRSWHMVERIVFDTVLA